MRLVLMAQLRCRPGMASPSSDTTCSLAMLQTFGKSVSQVFTEISDTPVAAASLGQVGAADVASLLP
jgi:predicted unusual protein kinase regulating ubiquinone biosynthesis (AarF/ABC1/UbiB family)